MGGSTPPSQGPQNQASPRNCPGHEDSVRKWSVKVVRDPGWGPQGQQGHGGKGLGDPNAGRVVTKDSASMWFSVSTVVQCPCCEHTRAG